MQKALYRREGTDEVFNYPYHVGVMENVKQVVNLSCSPVGDGIEWPVIEGCSQYTLTVNMVHVIYRMHT